MHHNRKFLQKRDALINIRLGIHIPVLMKMYLLQKITNCTFESCGFLKYSESTGECNLSVTCCLFTLSKSLSLVLLIMSKHNFFFQMQNGFNMFSVELRCKDLEIDEYDESVVCIGKIIYCDIGIVDPQLFIL